MRPNAGSLLEYDVGSMVITNAGSLLEYDVGSMVIANVVSLLEYDVDSLSNCDVRICCKSIYKLTQTPTSEFHVAATLDEQ